VGTLAI